MEITQDTISHLAKLSNFSLDSEESHALEKDLKNIIDYISTLDELDTTGIDPTYQCFEMSNVFRPDEIATQDADRTSLLDLAPETKDNQIKVPKVL